ncbi:transposase family protein [Streptomyces sp. NPDC059697]|uniref:transposase family protein n=1 Tax=Streptomyces sp. NPDC059697 TaxID=3346912 RepID=UPI0036C10555
MIASTFLWCRLVDGARLAVCVVVVGDLLPQLAVVQVERVEAGGGLLRVTARTRDDAPAACPGCGQGADWVHSRHVRRVADEAVGGRAVVIDLSVRRLYCENPVCEKVTFVEQVEGLTRRYQRRTPTLQRVVDAVAVALAGSAGPRLLGVLHHILSWASVLNCLMRITLPVRPAPRVLGNVHRENCTSVGLVCVGVGRLGQVRGGSPPTRSSVSGRLPGSSAPAGPAPARSPTSDSCGPCRGRARHLTMPTRQARVTSSGGMR